MSGTPGVGYRVLDPDSPKGSELSVLVIRGINPEINRAGEARRGEPGVVYRDELPQYR
jgi:hypothetical protein